MNDERVDLDDYEVPFKGIVEQAIAGIYILQDGRFRYVNETFALMCGIPRDQIQGAKLKDVASPQQVAALLAQYERRIQGEGRGERFIIHRTSQRRPGSFEIHGTRVMFHGRPAIVGVGIDITEQERQRQELVTASERLQELVANANSVRENERNRVSRELHDVLGGMLTAIKFDLSRLSWGIEKMTACDQGAQTEISRDTALAALASNARQLIQLTQDAVDAVRAISEDLRPGALDHLGLADTLSQSLERFQRRYGTATRIRTSGVPQTLDRDAEVGVYRIFQEALTNVARHSKATEVAVQVDWRDSDLSIHIADNGLGFDTEAAPHDGHLGLLGMQERARELGGLVSFGTGPKSGACIRLVVPTVKRRSEGESA